MKRLLSSYRCSSSSTSSLHMVYGDRHLEFRQSIGQFIDKDINPHVDRWEAEKRFPARQLFKQLGNLGVFGVNRPIAYGGLDLDFSYSIAIAEELGRIACGAIPMAICVQSNMATPALAEFGSDYLKRQFLAPTISGDMIACLGVSESTAGSDVAAIRTTAIGTGDDGDLIINGSKQWITNGIQADWICLLANTNRNTSLHNNKSLICVRLDEPGVHISANIEKLGMHSSDTAEIVFDNVRVPRSHIIGNDGEGFRYQMMQFQDERLISIAVLIEPLMEVLQSTIEYTRGRRAFGRAIIDNQYVHYTLAELHCELEAVRSLLYRACIERRQGRDVTVLASIGKLKAARLARHLIDTCLQFWGGVGYTWSNRVARYHRDFRLFSIAGGCDEVMLAIVCKAMRTLPK